MGSVGNLGSTPPLAVLGLASVFFYVLPALVSLVPVSLVAAELASGWPRGVYNWVSQGISAPMGLLAAGRDLAAVGARLAAQAIAAGLVDEYQLFVVPAVVGGGLRALPEQVRLNLALAEERRFGGGTVYLCYRQA